MKITEITESINFYDRFGHDTGPQTLPYTVEVRDRETGGKKLISIQAVSAADARERARDRGYRVVRVVSQDESQHRKNMREHDGRDDEPEETDDDGRTMADRARRDGRGGDDEPETAAQRRKRSLQATRDFNRGRRADGMGEGVAEGIMDTLKGAAKEFTRDSLQKKIKQAWENTFWPKHIEPALNRIQINGQPFRRMVLGEPRVIENDRSRNAILKQYTVNIVFPIDPEQWSGDEIRYLEGQLRNIEDGDWNPKVHGLGLVSFDQPMKSFQYTKGSVPDLVIPVRITSLDINRSLVGEQGVAEATGNPGMPHDFTAVQPGAEVWYKGRFAGWTTGKVYDDPYGKHGKMVAFEPNPSEFPGDEGRVLSLPYDEVSLRKSTSIGKLKGPKQGVSEGAKWRSNSDAHDINDDGDIYPKTRDMFAYDPLTRRQSTAGDARTARGKKSALKTSLKMAQGRHGPKSQLPEEQGVAEGHADQQRTIVKRNGQPVGEVGIDRESSPGAGQYYMKHYASGTDLSGYGSREEALGELKHYLKQGVRKGKKS